MTPEEAIAGMRSRWAMPAPDVLDVEERAAIRLADGPYREVLVLARRAAAAPAHVRMFVRVTEEDRVKWGKGKTHRLVRGWHSGYVHELADVDRILDGLSRRLGRCA